MGTTSLIGITSCLVFFGIFDFLWFQYSMPIYLDAVNTLTKSSLQQFPFGVHAVLAYLIMGVSTYGLVVANASGPKEVLWKSVLMTGVMFGVFNLTNAAMFGKVWAKNVLPLDITWGLFVVPSVSLLAYYTTRALRTRLRASS